MKKSEFTQLTQIIELLVAKEVRKQLPQVISEVFQNMMGGKSVVAESKQPITEAQEPVVEEEDPLEMKASLRELFAGGKPVTKAHLEGGQPRQQRTYVKDPVLNQILNETRPLRETERLAGMAAYQGGYNPAIPAAPVMNMTGVGEMMPESELPSFARNMPAMPAQTQASVPVAQPQPIREDHTPMAALPEGVSALDVARAGMLPQGSAVTEALTNYGRMKKILEQSKGKRY